MTQFKANLDTFPQIDGIARLELLDSNGNIAGVIENKAGSQGSLRLYLHLANLYGNITPEAAEKGLELYAEHTADAEENPGKHPNIDRLFEVIENKQPLTIRKIAA
jgi:hypothetical protein